MSNRSTSIGASLLLALAIGGPPAAVPTKAQDVYAYPTAGQSPERQSRDRFECHQWAVQQTGFDPTSAPPPPAQAQPQGSGGGTILGLGQGGLLPGTGLLGDAATGAGLGAAGGAIAGNAGKGAAIGAVGGAVLGGLARSQQPAAQAQPPSPDASYYYQRRGNYNQAFAACMRSRNYTVQ